MLAVTRKTARYTFLHYSHTLSPQGASQILLLGILSGIRHRWEPLREMELGEGIQKGWGSGAWLRESAQCYPLLAIGCTASLFRITFSKLVDVIQNALLDCMFIHVYNVFRAHSLLVTPPSLSHICPFLFLTCLSHFPGDHSSSLY